MREEKINPSFLTEPSNLFFVRGSTPIGLGSKTIERYIIADSATTALRKFVECSEYCDKHEVKFICCDVIR